MMELTLASAHHSAGRLLRKLWPAQSSELDVWKACMFPDTRSVAPVLRWLPTAWTRMSDVHQRHSFNARQLHS